MADRAGRLAPAAIGLAVGLIVELDRLSAGGRYLRASRGGMAVGLLAAAAAGALLFTLLRSALLRFATRTLRNRRAATVDRLFSASCLVFLGLGLGAAGYPLGTPIGRAFTLALALVFAAVNALSLAVFSVEERQGSLLRSRSYLSILFFLSGIAALVYQITWERVLFNSFGVNIESVTMIVTIFMLGLGLGALWGGRLSRRAPERLPLFFLRMEAGIGLFGLVSVPLIHGAGVALSTAGLPVVALCVTLLLLPPTLMMGATLPILVEYLMQTLHNLGRTVGLLYFANTLGSACACFLVVDVLFVYGGRQSAVLAAALFNFTVGALVYDYARRLRAAAPAGAPAGVPAAPAGGEGA